MKQFMIFLALLVIIGLLVVAFFSQGTFVLTGSVAPDTGAVPAGNSAAALKARADDSLRVAQQQQADAHAAAANETSQAQSAGSAASRAAQATAQALAVARTQIKMTADAANFPSTQSAIYAGQTAQAMNVQTTADARAVLLAQQQAQALAVAQAVESQHTAEAAAVQGTGDARAMLRVQQEAQTTATAQAMSAQQTAQSQVAQSTTQAMQLEGVAAIQAAGNAQRQNELMGWLLPLVAAIAFVVALFLGAKFMIGRIDAADLRSSLKSQRLRLPSILYKAPAETILYGDDPRTGFPSPQLIYTQDNDSAYDTGSPLTGPVTGYDTIVRPVIGTQPKKEGYLTGRAELREEADRRKLAMKLIRSAIDAAGAQSSYIPGATQLGWHAELWEMAVAILNPYGVDLLPAESGETYLRGQFHTLQALYLAIGESGSAHTLPFVGNSGSG
jgi:hypothetical protein